MKYTGGRAAFQARNAARAAASSKRWPGNGERAGGPVGRWAGGPVDRWTGETAESAGCNTSWQDRVMILADTRFRLTRDDAQLATRLLASESGQDLGTLEARLADEGIDAILDDPRLPAALRRDARAAHASLPLFAYVLIRSALRQAGEPDRGLADYVTAIVLNFGVRGRAYQISNADDEVYDAIVDLCEDLNDQDARRSFLVRAHLGNYALWLSGIFPDFIEHRSTRRGGPDLDYFEAMGRRGFQLAADHRLAEEHGMTMLFANAAARFGLLRTALNTVSDTLFFPNVHTPERLMRQARDEFRWKRIA